MIKVNPPTDFRTSVGGEWLPERNPYRNHRMLAEPGRDELEPVVKERAPTGEVTPEVEAQEAQERPKSQVALFMTIAT